LKRYGSDRALIEVLFGHLQGAPEEKKVKRAVVLAEIQTRHLQKQAQTATPLHQPITNNSNENNNSNSYRLFINAKHPRTVVYLSHLANVLLLSLLKRVFIQVFFPHFHPVRA
jgi:hypothetical protein